MEQNNLNAELIKEDCEVSEEGLEKAVGGAGHTGTRYSINIGIKANTTAHEVVNFIDRNCNTVNGVQFEAEISAYLKKNKRGALRMSLTVTGRHIEIFSIRQ